MIKDTVQQALQELFPSPESMAEENGSTVAATSEEAEDAKSKKDKKQAPRANGVVETDYDSCGYHLDVQLAPDQLVAAVTIMDQAGFFLENITGVDWISENELEAVYDFSRYDFDLCRVVIRTRTSREMPIIPTITEVFAGANWHERETHDFFGIKFAGHPYLAPLLLPEDADFHPLLKDFKP